jgi:hypothetical protein
MRGRQSTELGFNGERSPAKSHRQAGIDIANTNARKTLPKLIYIDP